MYAAFTFVALLGFHVIGKASGADKHTRCLGRTGCVNDVMSICSCDLHDEVCDVNCCCDRDCSSEDKKAFNECIDAELSTNSAVRVRRSMLFRDNSQYVANETDCGLLCVYSDNSEQINHYNSVNSLTEFDALRHRNQQASYSYNKQQTRTHSTYMSGDPILVLHTHVMTLGYLPFPSASGSSMTCIDSNPAAYLLSQTTTCVRRWYNSSEQCTSEVMFQASTFYDGFKVLQNSDVLSSFYRNSPQNRTAYGPLGEKYAVRKLPDSPDSRRISHVVPIEVNISGTTCLDVNGLPVKCHLNKGQLPKPMWDEKERVCKDAVREVTYMIGWSGEKGVRSVLVWFTLATISQRANTSMTQTFKTIFFKSTNNMPMPSTFVRYSGNPGYLVGLPMRAGKLVNIEEKLAIQLMVNNDRAMTMLSSEVGGWCDDSKSRVPIVFGINMHSGCFIRLTASEVTTALCNMTQWAVYIALQGADPATYVAMFGNSNPHDVEDWIEILGLSETPEWTASSPSKLACYNMLIGLELQVTYAYVGSFDNPQAQIIGVRYNYLYTNEFQLKCRGPSCASHTAGVVQRHLVTSSVTFVDVTTPPVVTRRH